jgi:hypothetical protein
MNSYRILVGKSERKRPLGRPRHRREDNIIIYSRDMGWDVMDWIDETQDRGQWRIFVNTEVNFQVE